MFLIFPLRKQKTNRFILLRQKCLYFGRTVRISVAEIERNISEEVNNSSHVKQQQQQQQRPYP